VTITYEPFQPKHLADAQALTRRMYEAARLRIPVLPADAVVPGLEAFAAGDMGVVACDGGRLVGHLAGVAPFDDLFGTVRGTVAPLEAHAVDPELTAAERRRIYSGLYEAVAERWVTAGALSHAVVVYADDAPAVDSLFWNGMGLRTIDAIRLVDPLSPAPGPLPAGSHVTELPATDRGRILPLHHGLTAHLRASPGLMGTQDWTAEWLAKRHASESTRVFGVQRGADLIGYMELAGEGETFVTLVPGMPNICGAFVLPGYRGGDVAAALLDFLIATLRREGSTHLGVDYECFNPTARGFWQKHFTVYTYGMTRRMDERVVALRGSSARPA
jgi:GNAT superfamily N-acetyltransferase